MSDLGAAILMLNRNLLFLTLVTEGMIVEKYLVAWRNPTTRIENNRCTKPTHTTIGHWELDHSSESPSAMVLFVEVLLLFTVDTRAVSCPSHAKP